MYFGGIYPSSVEGPFDMLRILRIDSAGCILYSVHRGQHQVNPALIEHVQPRISWQPCSSISNLDNRAGFEKGSIRARLLAETYARDFNQAPFSLASFWGMSPGGDLLDVAA